MLGQVTPEEGTRGRLCREAAASNRKGAAAGAADAAVECAEVVETGISNLAKFQTGRERGRERRPCAAFSLSKAGTF